jgi:hypothetical protein
MTETDLYFPVKRFLEAQGYIVKSEIKSCDVVAVRGNEPLVIVELKTGLTLQLLYQAVDRLTMTDAVYIAISSPKRSVSSQAIKLCRRIGVGLMSVAKSGSLEVLADPVPYAPRQNIKRKTLLLREFAKREGDPNVGGSTRKPLMTAYRQDALRCVQHLTTNGASRIRDVKSATGVDRASTILRDNVYGWFAKQERGIYDVTDAGRQAPSNFKA